MFKWKKLGRVFDPQSYPSKTWMNEYTQAPSSLVFPEFVRVYFSCRSKQDSARQFVSYAAYVDLDRQNLFRIIRIASKPVLQLGKKGCFDEFGTYPISVIKENGAILAYYGGWTRCESTPFNTAIGFARSYDDGVTFQKLGDGPILSYSLDEPFNIGSAKIRKYGEKYYLFYVAGKKWILAENKPEMSLKIRMASSIDGLNWNKQNVNLISEVDGEDESQASPDVFYKNGKYHMFFCHWIPSSFRRTKKRTIGYAYSYDLLNWIRDDTRAGIDVSDEGWDSEMLAYPHVMELDNKTYLFYLGNEVGRHGFGLAELQGDLI